MNNIPFHRFVHLFLLVLVFKLLSISTIAQSSILFKGRIYDSSTNLALPYAAVSITTAGIGTTTNQQGDFVFQIPNQYRNENVLLSFMAYENQSIKVNSIHSDSSYFYHLIPIATSIKQVNVDGQKNTPPKEMVEKALKNIYKNGSKKRFLLSGYYRDYIRNVKTEDYENLTEAAVQIEDRGVHTNDLMATYFKVEQIRFHPSFNVDQDLITGYGYFGKIIPFVTYLNNNELTILRGQDPIRNRSKDDYSFIKIFDLDYINDYTFHYNACTEMDSTKIYEIGFSAIPIIDTDKKAYFQIKGKIFVENQNYAIIKLMYTVNSELPNYVGKFMDVRIEYKKYKKNYYLNYLSAGNYFEYDHKSKTDSVITGQYFQYRELFVNKIEKSLFKRVLYRDAINKYTPLTHNKVPVQEGFWEKYKSPQQVKLLD